MKQETPSRIKVESDFKSTRGYKSVHARVREQVLFNQRKHEVVPVKEEEYEEQVVE